MAILDMTDDELRTEFHRLTAQSEAIKAVAGPLREARDLFARNARAQESEMNVEIKEAEGGLFDIEQRRARISRMLNGNTGEPPEA